MEHCQWSVTYAHESGDLTLLVKCLVNLSDASLITGQQEESLNTYLQAERYSKGLSGFVRSQALAQLSQAHAQQGNNQEVNRCIDEAYATFTEPDSETPVFLRTDYGQDQTILFEGLSAIDLGSHAKDQGNLHLARKRWNVGAETLMNKMKQLPSGLLVPVRIEAEMLLAQALAYALARNKEGFLTAFKKGAKLAKELGSEKREAETRKALHVAIEQWPNDKDITGLWEWLMGPRDD